MSISQIAAGLLAVANASLVGYTAVRLARNQSQTPLDLLFYTLLAGVVETVGICVALGAAGLLGWPEVLVAEGVVAAGARYRIPAPKRIPSTPVVWWPAVIAAVVILSISLVIALSSPSMDADTTTYHLLNAATWLHNGNIWQLPFTTPNGPDATAPGNADIFTTWLMLPSHSDQIACLTPIVFGTWCALATAQLAHALGASTRRAVVIALAIVVTPLIALTQSHSALVDLAVPAGIVSALVLALRARSEDKKLMWLCAGVCLGFAAGSKVVALLPSIFGLCIMVTLARRPRWPASALLITGYAPLGAVWYARNWVDAGNPLFPDVIRFGPVNFRGAPLSDETSVVSQVLTGHWAIVGNVIGLAAELTGPVLVILVVSAFQTRHVKEIAGRIGLLSALMIIGYLATPYTGGGPSGHTDEIATAMRYLFSAIFVSGAVAATVMSRRIFRMVVAASALYGALIFASKASEFRSDLALTAADIAIATLLVFAACGAIGLVAKAVRSGRLHSGRTTVVAVAVAFCGAWALYSRLPAQATDGVIQTINHRVAAVGVPYPRSLLGSDLSTMALSVGNGPQGAQTIITDTRAFNNALVDLNVNVLAVGWTSGIVPNGWTVGSEWVEVGHQAGAIVYQRR